MLDKNIFRKVFIKHPNICVALKLGLTCVFLFLGKKTLGLKKSVQNATERPLAYYKVKIVFKSPSKIVKHFPFKDVLPKNPCSGIAYSFKCNRCNTIYYYKTSRYFYVFAFDKKTS